MIDFEYIDLLSFFEQEPRCDESDPTVFKYQVVTSTMLDLVFTIDDALGCAHVAISKDGVVIVNAGTEGVVKIEVFGEGENEFMECEVAASGVEGKVFLAWKSAPHFRSHLLAIE